MERAKEKGSRKAVSHLQSKIVIKHPWPDGLVGWSIIPYTKRLWVQFPVRACT